MTTYRYGTNAFKVCESEMFLKNVKVKMLEVKITIKYSITTTNIKNDQL